MKPFDLTVLARELAQETRPYVERYVAQQLAPLKEQLAAQAKATAVLKQRPVLQHRGVWREDGECTSGDMTTHKGAVWIALRPTTARPGTADSGWRMVEKAPSHDR